MPPPVDVALNGERDHPAAPRTPEALAAEARAAHDAGARVLHLHPFDAEGRQTLEAEPCAAAIRAVRAACPGAPVSLSTSAAIEPDPERRAALVAGWTDLPDLVTANQSEEGIVALAEALLARGVGIEAGLLSVADAEAFVASALPPRCERALVEALEELAHEGLATAEGIERVLAEAGVGLEQVHHGEGLASWVVSDRGARRGHGVRVGLEDCPLLPDGRVAAGNAELVAAGVALVARAASEA